MIKTNNYFEGKVQSLGFKDQESQATVGVILPGEYQFNTGAREVMTIISGILKVQLFEKNNWQDFSAGKSFEIAANSSFKVIAHEPVAYLCRYY